MEYVKISVRVTEDLNPDFPFEYIPCKPYIEDIVARKEELRNYRNVVKVVPATEQEWVRYQRITFG